MVLFDFPNDSPLIRQINGRDSQLPGGHAEGQTATIGGELEEANAGGIDRQRANLLA